MKRSPSPVPRRGGAASVLLVDDAPSNLLALTAVLARLGVRMVTAASGAEALEHVAREPFAVALVDVQMPGMDGFEVTRRIRALEHGRELPVVFVTAVHLDEQYVKKGYACGAADYITKPYDPDIIFARVKAFVDLFEQREAVRRGQVALRTQERDEAIRRLVALERIATAALETNDLSALLDELLQAFKDAADAAESAAILLVDGDSLEVKAAVGLEAGGDAERVRIGEGFAGRIAAERRPIELSDLTERGLLDSPLARVRGARALYGMPLLHGGQLLGVAFIGSARASTFSEPEKRLFRAAAERAALAVARTLELSSLHEILAAAPAFIAIVRAIDDRYVFANRAYQALFESPVEGATLDQLGLGRRVFEAVEKVKHTGESVHVDELSVVIGGGVRPSSGSPGDGAGSNASPLYLRVTAHPLLTSSGKVDRVLMFAVDMTAQVIARQDLERAQASRAELLEREREARRAAEVASISKDEFLATVSHELRTPLNAILGWATMARANGVPDTDRAFAIIERNAQAQARIVEDVLDFSRIARGKMRLTLASVDFELVVREAIETVKPAAEAKGIDLVADIRVERRLSGDPERLQQVVWNLLTNAIKFTREGGRVSVRARNPGTKVTLVVSDNGQGIDPEFVPYVFDPFRQANGGTTRRHGGVGLGLAIVKQIVQAHGGTIEAASEGRGRGATFTLALWVDAKIDDTRASVHPRPLYDDAPASSDLGGLKVLVVDDDDDNREFLAGALASRGAAVACAASVRGALDEMERFHPDVLVSDIAMPDADGYELMRRVRALPPEMGGATPAVAVTAHTKQETRERARAAGFQRVEPKPVDMEQLMLTLVTLGRATARAVAVGGR